jgi:phosphoesterase RecJ-like protein
MKSQLKTHRAIMIPEEILQTFREKTHFVIATHMHPDGDALGSLLGLIEILKKMDKKVFGLVEEPVPDLYRFFPQSAQLNTSRADLHDFLRAGGSDSAAVVLDCGEIERLGSLQVALAAIKPLVVIDHHQTHQNYGDYRWIEPTSSSTGEMIYEVCEALGQTPTLRCAFDLYVAIVSDTGSFRYECTGARTLEIAAKLVGAGVNPQEVASHLYDNYKVARLKLMEMVLGTLRLHEENSIAFIHVTREMFARSGALAEDAEGFINYPRALAGVKVSAFLKEMPNETISVSLRAKGACDVSEVAKRFGGGGHRNAAGCRFNGIGLEDVHNRLHRAIRSALQDG